ncbi:hypothetical protein J3D55_000827 [Chryseobacterium ginsenosidimutans]|nr:hypothetical protein [Chryseobacterium ginsenosidimutans]
MVVKYKKALVIVWLASDLGNFQKKVSKNYHKILIKRKKYYICTS